MTREDVIRMAREADILVPNYYDEPGATLHQLERFAALVAAHEREACCKIVYGLCESDNVAQRTVDAIRARGET